MIKNLTVLSSLIAVSVYCIQIISSPLPYEVIDQNKNGIIGLFELLDASDIESRIVEIKGNEFAEYYWLKDGLTAHIKDSTETTP